jgi:hypothetical protein
MINVSKKYSLTLTSVTLVPPIDDENERSEQMLLVSDASSLSSHLLVERP